MGNIIQHKMKTWLSCQYIFYLRVHTVRDWLLSTHRPNVGEELADSIETGQLLSKGLIEKGLLIGIRSVLLANGYPPGRT